MGSGAVPRGEVLESWEIGPHLLEKLGWGVNVHQA